MALRFNDLLNPYIKRWQDDEENRKTTTPLKELPNTPDPRVRGLINPSSSSSSSSTSSYSFNPSNLKSSQMVKQSTEDSGIFSPTAFAKYSQDNKETPDWLKPIGFALESPFRIPAVNRLFSSAAKVAGGENAIADNAPINTYSTDTRNSFLNKSADVLGGLVGFGLSPRVMGVNSGTANISSVPERTSSLGRTIDNIIPRGINGGDANLFTAGNSLADGISTKLGTFIKNPLLNKASTTLSKGAIDGGLGNLAYDIGQNKDINELPQSALIGAAGGAALFGLGGLASGGSKLSKMATTKIDDAINNIGSKTDYTPQEEALISKGTNALDNIETPVIKAPTEVQNPMTKSIENNIDNTSILQKNFPIGSKVSFNANMGRGKGEVIGYKTDKWGNEWAEIDTGVKSQTGIGTIKDFKRIDDDIKLEGSNKTTAANIDNNTVQKNIPLPQNESTITNNDEIAAALGSQVKESKFKTNIWENSPFMADEATQKMVKDIDATYDVQTNEENLQVALYRLNKDFNGVVDRITKEGIQTAEDSVASGLITNRLIQEAKTTGDYSKVSSWLKVVRPEVTNLAQSLQALSTWKRLTPEGTLLKAQKIVDGAIDNIKKENPKKFEEVQKQIEKNPGMADEILKKNNIPQLTNDDIKFITDQMNKVEQMKDGRAKDIEFAKVKQLMADKIVPTFSDKIKAAQRISLLLNTKTMTRNILGNVVMSGLENAKDVPGAAIDKLISKTTGKRTTLMPSAEGIKTQLKGGVKGVKEAVEDYKLGINTNPSAGQYELPSAQAFKGGVMGKLEKVTNAGLTLGDRPFWQGAYDDALRQQLKINKVKEPTEEMIKAAQDIANERTFQNTNALVKGFKDIQKALNLGKDFGLGNFVIPFTKTPANILDKAIDYSPIGGAKGVYNLINGLKKGTLNQKQVVDQLGRGITGSTLMAIGYTMAKGGVLTGQANKDKDVATLEKQAGKSPYAVKTGDTYRTIDWMQPAAIPLMIGADIFHQGKNEKELKNVIANAVVSGGNTLFNQSLLQGIQKFFNTSNSSSGGIMENIGNTITQAPTQFVPSALKEINQLIDNKQRDTAGGVINQIKAKVPGLAQTLPVKYDTMGREMKTYKNGNNLWNVGFNPGFTTTYSPSEGEKAALDIFEENGNKTQFPQVMDNKITYTDSKTKKKAVVDLTPKEKQELQKNVGQRVNDKFSTIKGGSVEDRIKDMEKILRDIKKEEEDKILRSKGLSRK